MMTTSIWWLRRDLRLRDNQALTAALAKADTVVPLFIIDPRLVASPYGSEKRLAFLWGGLREVDHSLRQRGSRLIVRTGFPMDVLPALVHETGAQAVFAEADYSPYARWRDQAIAARLPLRLVDGVTVHPPPAVVKADGAPYIVYTPYSRAWKGLLSPRISQLLAAPLHLTTPADVVTEPLPVEPDLPAEVPFPPGEEEAQRRLVAFVAGDEAPVFSYGDDRNRMDLTGTSQLSPYLRFGMVSARQAAGAALAAIAEAQRPDARKSAETWLNELIWREFYIAILYHFPHVRGRSFRPDLAGIAWSNDQPAFQAWCEGRTGYPVVDAAMRQLAQTGWMHNRARMIAASFLIKDLLIDWRWGERWFMQHLVDGDPAANNGGWQWTAGTGTDAAPYFRIFNPVLQSLKFDPDGAYIRRWLRELAEVPAPFIHKPWEMPLRMQQELSCILGRDYPAPIIDHDWARGRTLDAYGQARTATN